MNHLKWILTVCTFLSFCLFVLCVFGEMGSPISHDENVYYPFAVLVAFGLATFLVWHYS